MPELPPTSVKPPTDPDEPGGTGVPEGTHTPIMPPGGFVSIEAGTVIAGRYKLAKELGHGGMGAVWMAEQTEPVRRLVALKLILTGMDSHEFLTRFEAERQALSMMDHPNIARVFDAGTLPDSRPFFVMELVKGIPITKYCDDQKLTPRQRLELFVPVCNAIQHAHQKGIIHRDIKPNNVLVAVHDDKPVPKVIDFGVAKATGQPLSDKTMHTLGIVGTPEYMSPEQATENQLDIDTRSDVYSLGVLLYELLTGTTPVKASGLKQKVLLEILRIVREVEAPRLSTFLSSTDTLPSIAAVRGTEPARLSKEFRGELDWIAMKALEKDRTRRYETANGFAADVQRYLTGEPVLAHPPSAGYRLKKFVRRHKGQVIAASLILLALIGGAIGTTYGVIEAGNRREANSLREQAEYERDAAVAARGEAVLAQTGEKSARDELQQQQQQERERRIPEFHSLANEAEFHLLGAYWALLPHEQTKTSRRIDSPNSRGADLKKGMETVRQALAMYGLPDSDDALNHLRIVGLEQVISQRLRERCGELLFLWSMAVERLAQGADGHTAACREALRLLDSARKVGNESKSLMLHRATLCERLGDMAGAAEARAAADARADETFLDHHLRGASHSRQKQYEAAFGPFQQALTIRPRDYWTLFRLAKSFELYGVLKNDPGYLGQAEIHFVTCIGLRPDDPTAYNNRLTVLQRLGRFSDAVSMGEKILEVDPQYLMAWGNLALSHAEMKNPKAAEAVLRRYTEHPKVDRSTPAGQREHARVLGNVALAYERVRNYKAAVDYGTRSLELAPNDPGTLRNRAIALDKLERFEEAEADIRKALSLRPEEGGLYYVLGNVLANLGRGKVALEAYDRAVELLPKHWDAWYNRGVLLRRLGRDEDAFRDQTQVIKNSPKHALAYYERGMIQAQAGRFRNALDDVETFLALEPDDVPGLILRGQIHADLKINLDPLEQSEQDLTRAIQVDPKNSSAYRARGLTRYRATNWAGAIADYRKYLQLSPNNSNPSGILNDIAVAHQNAGQFEEAIKTFGEALAIRQTPSLLTNRGNVYLEQGDLILASADFDAAIKLNKDFDRAWGLRAQVRLRSEDWAGAIADLDLAEKLFPGHFEMLTLRGFAHYAAGDAAAARKDWARVVKERPDHVRGKFCRSALALLDGKPTDAVEGLVQALGDAVLAPYATLLLARAWVALSGPGVGPATKYAENLVRLRPKEWAASLEAARIHALASTRVNADAAVPLRNRAIELLLEAVKLEKSLRGKLSGEAAFESLLKDPRFPN